VLRKAIAGLLALLVLGACSSEPDDLKFHGKVLENPYAVPDTALTDTDGQPFSLAADTDKRLTLLFFGFTNCPDICSTVLGALASARTRLDADDLDQVEVVFVTTDPARDDEQTIRDYLDRFDPSFIGLRSDLDTTIAVGEELAVGIDRTDPGGHTTTTLAIDSADETPVYWGEETSAAQFASDIHSLLEE
jgi:protein SCO1/2